MLGKFAKRLPRIPWRRLAAGAGSRAAALARRAVKPLLFAGPFALVVVLVHREVYSFLVHRPGFRVPSFRLAVSPPWGEPCGVQTVPVETVGGSLFDPDLVERVGRAFESCPWVRRVVSVERVFPGSVRVRLEYRRPRLAFRGPSGFVLVDPEGVRLPGVYAEPPPYDRPLKATGAFTPPPDPGRTWEDPAVRAGLEMAELVRREALLSRLGVEEIDLTNLGGRQDLRRSEVVLVLANGCLVHWGRVPSRSRFGDPTPAEKIESLRDVLAVYPGLNGLRAVRIGFRGSRSVEPAGAWARKPR